jgi:hypothetical protein
MGRIKKFEYKGKTLEAPNEGSGYKKKSAYSNAYAVKLYNELGGGWKTASLISIAMRISTNRTADLGKWFKEKWVALDNDGDIIGECAQSHSYPEKTREGQDPLKCLPKSKAKKMTKSERAEAARRKSKEEKKQPDKRDKTPTYVRTKK